MIFLGDAQVSKYRREEGGVIRTRGYGEDRALREGKGVLRKTVQGSQCRYEGFHRVKGGHRQGGGLRISVSEEEVLGDDMVHGDYGEGQLKGVESLEIRSSRN